MRRFWKIAAAIAALASVSAAGDPVLAGSRAKKPAPAAPVIAAAVEITGDSQKARFAVALSKPVAPHAFLMEGPNRVIVDLPDVAFHVAGEGKERRGGLIGGFRYGLFAPGRSRLVVDLAEPALVSHIEVERHPLDGSALLVIELAKTDSATFAATAAQSQPPVAVAAVPPPRLTPKGKDTRPVVVLDPGHGGIDPGAKAAAGMLEKDLVFAFAEKLRKKLEGTGRYRVLLTRTEDVFVPLGERVRTAQAAGADLFVSIHADSISGGQEVRGLTVYTVSERASDADSARLADRENQSDALAGAEAKEGPGEIADILQELTSRETRAFSHAFASRLVGELDGVSRLNKNPHRQAGFRVLRAHDVPSILIELGYLSSRKDFDLLMSDDWRDRSTAAMTEAIDRFFAPRLAKQGLAPVSP